MSPALGTLNAALGLSAIGFCTAARGRMLARATWLTAARLLFVGYWQIGFAIAGLALLSAHLSRGEQVVLVAGCALASTVAGAFVSNRLATAWDAALRTNEHEVLDLRHGTFLADPGFVFRSPAQQQKGQRNLGRWYFWTPILIALIVSVDTPRLERGVVIAGLLLFCSVLLTWATVPTLFSLRKLRHYERQLGRPILNR